MPDAQQSFRNKQADKAESRQPLTIQQLVRMYAPAVLGVCMAYTRNLHDSEDMVQETFLKTVSRFETLTRPDRARSWLMQIARRTCMDHQCRRRTPQTLAEDLAEPQTTTEEPVQHLHEAISRLSDTYRETITLYYLKRRNCADVAQDLGISEQAVRRRLVRARLQLHEILSEDKS